MLQYINWSHFQSNFHGTLADSFIQYALRIFERYVC